MKLSTAAGPKTFLPKMGSSVFLLAAAAALSASPVAPAAAASAPIELVTPRFKITLDPATCLATTTVADALLRQQQPAEPGATGGRAARSSTPVPFMSLYNRVSDSRPTNLSPCSRVTLRSGGGGGLTVLEVFAAHGAGSLLIIANVSTSGHLFLRLGSLAAWHGRDPIERHVEFGAFWTGILNNSTAPIVM